MPAALNIAVIGGDGIGPEVTAEAVKVLREALGGELETTEYPLGAAHYLETGEILSDATLAQIAQHDAILLGAVGGDPRDARLAGGIIERGLLLKLRFALEHAVNLRPSKAHGMDFVIVREGTEGPYAGNGGRMREGTPGEIATEVSVNTYLGVERVVRRAFEIATARSGRLTMVHKTNVLVHAGALWRRVTDEVAAEFPGVAVDYLHVDAATIHLVNDPGHFDVIVTDNLFGDILTDLAGAVGGGIGLAASANLNVDGTYPSMFEPVHGSAPDIAGTGKADPAAAILSAAMLAEELGHADAAAYIRDAVRGQLAERDPATPQTTAEIGDRVAELAGAARSIATAYDEEEGGTHG